MKPHFGFLSFCLLLAALLLSNPLHAAFKIDVHINGAENPTLTFGEAGARTRAPHPPFSGMFGVADVCFAGPVDAPEWYDRLAEDVKTANTANQWILVAKSNARITWKLKEGTLPENLKIAWKDIKTEDDKVEDIVNNSTLSLKAGTTYTIQASDNIVPAVVTDNSTQFAKKVGGVINPVVFDLGTPTEQLDTLVVCFTFNAGIGEIRFAGETGKPGALWEITFNPPGNYTIETYAWDSVNPTILVITLKKTGTIRADGDWQISLTPQKTSVPPISISETTNFFNDIDNDTLFAIMLRSGTLDFDGDTVVTLNDVYFLYNFVSQQKETTDPAKLQTYTVNATPDYLATALTYFQTNKNESELDFDGDQRLTLDDVYYLYNFISQQKETTDPAKLQTYTSNATPDKLNQALETFKEFVE